MSNAVDPVLLTVPEVATRLRVSRVSVHRWIAEGRLTATRLGERVVRVSEQDLDAFIANGSTERAS